MLLLLCLQLMNINEYLPSSFSFNLNLASPTAYLTNSQLYNKILTKLLNNQSDPKPSRIWSLSQKHFGYSKLSSQYLWCSKHRPSCRMSVKYFRMRSKKKQNEYFLVEGSLTSASFQMNVCLSAHCHKPSLFFILLSLPSSADPAPQNSSSCSPFSSIRASLPEMLHLLDLQKALLDSFPGMGPLWGSS